MEPPFIQPDLIRAYRVREDRDFGHGGAEQQKAAGDMVIRGDEPQRGEMFRAHPVACFLGIADRAVRPIAQNDAAGAQRGGDGLSAENFLNFL